MNLKRVQEKLLAPQVKDQEGEKHHHRVMSLEKESCHRQVMAQEKESFPHLVKNQGQENSHPQVRNQDRESFPPLVRSLKENSHHQAKDQSSKVPIESNPLLQTVLESVTIHHLWKFPQSEHPYLESSLLQDPPPQLGEDQTLRIPLRINHVED